MTGPSARPSDCDAEVGLYVTSHLPSEIARKSSLAEMRAIARMPCRHGLGLLVTIDSWDRDHERLLDVGEAKEHAILAGEAAAKILHPKADVPHRRLVRAVHGRGACRARVGICEGPGTDAEMARARRARSAAARVLRRLGYNVSIRRDDGGREKL